MKNSLNFRNPTCKDPFEGTLGNFTLFLLKTVSTGGTKLDLVVIFHHISGNESLVYSLRHKTTFLV